MNTVLIPPGPGGYGKGLWLPVASGKKVLSLTGREIHPVAIEIGALTESEIVNGFSDIPPDNDILCVVITLFDSWILTAIHRFAALVQLLPASQSHHHSIPGGLLDHSLEVTCNAVRLRQGYLLPPEAGAEEQARQASAWTVAVVCAALLHDTGKIAVDMEIHQLDSTRWHP